MLYCKFADLIKSHTKRTDKLFLNKILQNLAKTFFLLANRLRVFWFNSISYFYLFIAISYFYLLIAIWVKSDFLYRKSLNFLNGHPYVRKASWANLKTIKQIVATTAEWWNFSTKTNRICEKNIQYVQEVVTRFI